MGRRIQSLILAAMTAAVVLCLAACTGAGSAASDADNGDRPVIKAGSADYPPFIYLDNDGNPTGIDVDVLNEAAARIGYDVDYVDINWEFKDELLEAGDIDCITGGFTVEGREDRYRWIGPYLRSNQVFAVNAVSDIYTYADLKDKSVSVQIAGIAEQYVLDDPDNRIPQLTHILSGENSNMLFAALSSNYVDAVAADEPVVLQYAKDYKTDFRILDEPLIYANVGTAFAKDADSALCESLDNALSDMREDGTLSEIIGRYFDEPDKFLEVTSLED